MQQLLIQYIRLFPLAKKRCADNKLADRLEQTLRLLSSKYNKKQKTENIIRTINEVTQEMKSESFTAAFELFLQEEEPAIVEREIEISNQEVEEQKQLPNSQTQKPPANKRAMYSNSVM